MPWRALAFGAVLVAYLIVIIGVLHRSPERRLDRVVWRFDFHSRWPQWFPWIRTYAMLGQRGPATLTALPWFIWRAWKSRSARPLVMLVTALVVLNVSVGVVKVATGRIGPMKTHAVTAVLRGGNIFPSGHTSNAVVLYGLIAMLAVSWRKVTTTLAVIISLTVGLSTVYLDTHWLSDVVGGWMAGGLVLLSLPTLTPLVERAMAWAARFGRSRLPRRALVPRQAPRRHAPTGPMPAPASARAWSTPDLPARR